MATRITERFFAFSRNYWGKLHRYDNEFTVEKDAEGNEYAVWSSIGHEKRLLVGKDAFRTREERDYEYRKRVYGIKLAEAMRKKVGPDGLPPEGNQTG